MASIRELIKNYTKAIREGNAAIFAGAGLSRPSGYVDWKNLLRPLANEIDLDVDKENDLVSVAQYYRNRRSTRGSINQTIVDAFSKDAAINENVRIVTRLPISTYWTTNYDHLLEEGFRENNRKPDVKINQDQLALTIPGRDAVVYKMHGDVNFPFEAVLTKDDYETYECKRPLFRTALKGDLVSKTFLFIGFSFEDPNLDCVFSQIHALIGENKRDHYCFFKKLERSSEETEEEFNYRKIRQKLREEDLSRYGIQAVIVDEYNQITEILKAIECAVKRRNVFISGSAEIYDGIWNQSLAEKFSYLLARELIRNDYKIISGFGRGVISSSIINGALSEIYESKYKHMEEFLCLRPFPQNIDDSEEKRDSHTKYRRTILEEVGISIFIFGNKMADGDVINATGCQEEFEISKEMGKIIIPVGSTGYAAKAIMDEIKGELDDKYGYLKSEWDALEKEKDIDKLIGTVMRVIKGDECNIDSL